MIPASLSFTHPHAGIVPVEGVFGKGGGGRKEVTTASFYLATDSLLRIKGIYQRPGTGYNET